MSDHLIDDLARAIATDTSRREALRRIGVGLTAGVAAFLLPRAAEASNDSKVQICHRTESAGNSVVLIEVDSSAVQVHRAHGDQFACNGSCCGPGQICCGGSCSAPEWCF